jgi:hypothetical protein
LLLLVLQRATKLEGGCHKGELTLLGQRQVRAFMATATYLLAHASISAAVQVATPH